MIMKNERKKYLSLAMISLFLTVALFLPAPVFAQDATTVSVITPDQVTTGEQFTINVFVEPKTAISGLQLDLTFNPSLVTVESVKEGGLMSQNGATTYFRSGTIDNVAGTINGIAGVIFGPGETISTAGDFAMITLIAKSENGTCFLTLSNVIVADIYGNQLPAIIVNGQLRIGLNQPPILAYIGNKTASKGENVSFTISASDPDGDILTYSASNMPPGANFDAATHTFSWTPRGRLAGAYEDILFEVSDGYLKDSEAISISIDTSNGNSGNRSGKGKGPKAK
jgi:hypothetical protein